MGWGEPLRELKLERALEELERAGAELGRSPAEPERSRPEDWPESRRWRRGCAPPWDWERRAGRGGLAMVQGPMKAKKDGK
ncbi:MAG: hypothetical protein HC824_17275 [Synechococcales cyanobacterium RM1_1_8]|nr:hypothetical protein [Synechococcales cyanobacterium RM1_1_8]